MDRESAERSTILRGLVGSTVHGLKVNDGIEDRDEMGICIEPLAEAMALSAPFEQFIYRSAAERAGREDARSIAGDLDLTIYSLRKWMRLALKGNPTILLLLFTPEDQLVHCDSLGRELRSLPPQIISRLELEDILPKLFDRVLIPEAVRRELLSTNAPEPVKRFMTARPDSDCRWQGPLACWIEPRDVYDCRTIRQDLGAGDALP